ncbi:hypothetical protein FB451DRAFT_1498156 [Mycena latifolia]|nr:hypothetical protein FB451DRAFT_1498156 [Mycena latifolia]
MTYGSAAAQTRHAPHRRTYDVPSCPLRGVSPIPCARRLGCGALVKLGRQGDARVTCVPPLDAAHHLVAALVLSTRCPPREYVYAHAAASYSVRTTCPRRYRALSVLTPKPRTQLLEPACTSGSHKISLRLGARLVFSSAQGPVPAPSATTAVPSNSAQLREYGAWHPAVQMTRPASQTSPTACAPLPAQRILHARSPNDRARLPPFVSEKLRTSSLRRPRISACR